MPWNGPDLAGAGFDPAAAEELRSRLRLAESRLGTPLAGRARIASEQWRGPRRAELDAELEALSRQNAGLLDEVRVAIVRVLDAGDRAEPLRRDQARAAATRPS